MNNLYITTSIPYVNGSPHLGHALEFVHVDVLARHRRRRGGTVRVQSGTDDHAIKNVSAPAATRGTHQASPPCGTPARPPATCTRRTTPACTARAANSSTHLTS